MSKRNLFFSQLTPNYLFSDVSKKADEYRKLHPDHVLVNLSIGDTSVPISETICQGLTCASIELGTSIGYRGYGPEQGEPLLREKISQVLYQNKVSPDEIFVSDGAKCDLFRLLLLFGPQKKVALQNPTYPAFADSAKLFGNELMLLPCTSENHFFPSFENVPSFDLLYFCSPNNPTGMAFSYFQLSQLIENVKARNAFLIYDAAYSCYIDKPDIPKSIYEIAGADEVAIEVSSFSKFAGFTGIRLGWTVVPKTLRYDSQESVNKDWNRIMTTVFNGASNISQAGGLSALSPHGQKEMTSIIDHYKKNTQLLKKAFQQAGFTVFGGEFAPYLWMCKDGQSSWDLFHQLLSQNQILATPGLGFGSCGEGFVRVSALGKNEDILLAVNRLNK